MSVQTSPLHPRSVSLWTRLAAVPAVVVLLLAGLWFFGGVVAPGYYSSIALGAVWFVAAYVGLRLACNRWPPLRRPVQLTFLATAAVVGAVFLWTTFRDVTVNEQIARGTPASQAAGAGNLQLASGELTGIAHDGSGTAAVVELAGGDRVLTLSNLDVFNGPDLRVYLVAGPVDENGSGSEFVDLGALKGNKGNQQYAIPPEADVEKFSTLVIWCRAFTVGFAKASLQAS